MMSEDEAPRRAHQPLSGTVRVVGHQSSGTRLVELLKRALRSSGSGLPLTRDSTSKPLLNAVSHAGYRAGDLAIFSEGMIPALVSLARNLLRCTTSALGPSLGFAALPVEPSGSFWYHDVLTNGAVVGETTRADAEMFRSGLFVPAARGRWRGILED